MSARMKRLQVGDLVTAEARIVFSDGRARMIASELGAEAHMWRTLRIDGSVCSKSTSGRWTVEFKDGDATVARTLRRGLLDFKMRPEKAGDAAAAAAMVELAGIEADDAGEDSDDQASVASDADAPEEAVEPNADTVAAAERHDGEWQRDDHANISQRAKDGVDHEYAATLNGFTGDVRGASLFDLGRHFLPVDFLTTMAELMERNGKARAKSNPDYKNWSVSICDVYQWIGCWLYMLAFPVPGPRSQYFKTPYFGPCHTSLKETLAIGDPDKKKSEFWFNCMCACFELPTYNTDPQSDKFYRVRRFWDCLRDKFLRAIVSGHILCLDESMVKWLGQGMPGFMVVQRKPTPKGLELHTMCDAQTGIMIYFEVYEGKIAMSTKEFTRERAAHVALTLRMCKPFFGKVPAPAYQCPRASSHAAKSDTALPPLASTAQDPDRGLVVRICPVRGCTARERRVRDHEREDLPQGVSQR